MKSLIICYECRKLVRENNSFSVKVNVSPKRDQIEETQDHRGRMHQVLVRICRDCARDAGYHVVDKSKVVDINKPSAPVGGSTVAEREV